MHLALVPTFAAAGSAFVAALAASIFGASKSPAEKSKFSKILFFAENCAVRVRERMKFTLTRYHLNFPRKKKAS
jgi:hypothetical protein